MASTKNYLISYDIANPKRLQKIHRLISRQALRLQYSVYHIQCNKIQLNRLIQDIENRIHPKEDDVRIYPISSCQQIEWFNQPKPDPNLFLIN